MNLAADAYAAAACFKRIDLVITECGRSAVRRGADGLDRTTTEILESSTGCCPALQHGLTHVVTVRFKRLRNLQINITM